MNSKSYLFLGVASIMLMSLSFYKYYKTGIAPKAIGPYMNGQLENINSANWTTENAFDDLVFNSPIWLKRIPNQKKYLLTQKEGQIYLIDDSADHATKQLLLNIAPQVFSDSDTGLFGIAFHPEFGQANSANRNFIYVAYNYRPDHLTHEHYNYLRLSRFELSEDFQSIDIDSEYVYIQHFDRHGWHTGGALFFDKYGFLNVSTGDEGGSVNDFGNGQIINSRLFGGILRIDIDQDLNRSHPIRRFPIVPTELPANWPSDINQGYYIPNDNPWVTETEDWLEEFYAIGLRSPHTMFYDSIDDAIWVADVGQSSEEDLSVLKKGTNGQWPYKEGKVNGLKPKPKAIFGEEVSPIYSYGNEEGKSIIGGILYKYDAYPQLTNKFIFGDFISQNVWALDPLSLSIEYLTNTLTAEGNFGFVSFETGLNGEIYLVQIYSPADGGGKVLKLLAPEDQAVEAPKLLSELGAFKNLESLEAIDGFIPYELNSELYSDNAIKKRWIAIPNDGTYNTIDEVVGFDKSEEWTFPEGTVFIKHFELPIDEADESITTRIETRFLIVSENNQTFGLTYKWNDDGTEAELLDFSDEKEFEIKKSDGSIRSQIWKYPSRTQCLTCHNPLSGGVLGPKTSSLNKTIEYNQTGEHVNQISAWGQVNIFGSTGPSGSIDELPKATSLNDPNSSNEVKVRSYIDTNCSFCHRPGGVEAAFDARFSTPIELQNIVCAPAIGRNSSLDALIVYPRDTVRSEMFTRVHKTGTGQMPTFGRSTIDEQFVHVLKDWIMDLDIEQIGTGSIEDNIVVYPNPSTNREIYIRLPPELLSYDKLKIKIISSLGKVLLQSVESTQKVMRLNVKLDQGVYFLEIDNSESIFLKKIIRS